jgi:hypothetical protein
MAWEIPYFRASVIENTGRQSDLFHNHKTNTAVIYRYPLIQYKVIDQKPAIICINAGTDDIHYLLENQEFFFDIKGKVDKYEVEELVLKNVIIQTWQDSFRYNIHNYMPFNQENYAVFQKLGSMKHQLQFIQELLYKHISIILEELEEAGNSSIPLNIEIEQVKSDRYIEYKGVHHMTYCLNIKTNVSLPNYIGIGKGVSVGFGIVKKLRSGKR